MFERAPRGRTMFDNKESGKLKAKSIEKEEYEHLKEKYRQLKLRYLQKSEKYKSIKKDKNLLAKQIRRWSREYQRLKITFAASEIEEASFVDYAATVESNHDELNRLKLLAEKLSVKNNELEQELESLKSNDQSNNWRNQDDNHEDLSKDLENSSKVIAFNRQGLKLD